MSHDQDMLDLIRWASQFGATVSVNGEIGFGRPCIGVLYGQSYVALGPQEKYDMDGQSPIYFATTLPETAPPPDVPDAYHKDEYWAVLGTGPDAEVQLVRWWKSILAQGEFGIKVVPTAHTDPFQVLLSGPTYAYLCPLADIDASSGGTRTDSPKRAVDDRPVDCPISRLRPNDCGYMSDPPSCTSKLCSRNLNQGSGR